MTALSDANRALNRVADAAFSTAQAVHASDADGIERAIQVLQNNMREAGVRCSALVSDIRSVVTR